MSDSAESGASIAWRLLATLEGGSLVLVTSALIAYTASKRLQRTRRRWRPVKTVLLTNTTSELGRALKRRLEIHGCTVKTSSAISGADMGASKEADVDALVVVGAKTGNGLNGISDLVMDDVHQNIKLLESLSSRVRRGGCMAWACVGADTGAFAGAAAAFDTVLHTTLQHVTNVAACEPIWVGRWPSAEQTAERVVAALLSHGTHPNNGYGIRNAALKFGEGLYRWLKTMT